MGRFLFSTSHVALCAVSFLAVAGMLRGLVPWPDEYGLRAKLEYWEEHANEFDAVFIGSSRTFRAVDPRIFDRELAEQGIAVRSFNLAVGGMRAFEQDFVLHEVLRRGSGRLRWVFLEGGPWDPEFDYSLNVFSWRSVFWHTLPQTLKALRSALAMPEPWPHRLELARTHLLLFLGKLTSFGQGHRVVQTLRGVLEDPRHRSLSVSELEEAAGYRAFEDQTGRGFSEAHEGLLADPAPFLERVAAISRENRAEVPASRINLPALRAQYRAAAAVGAELVYFIPPGYEGTPQRPHLHVLGEIPVLLDFNRPEEYPSFFQLEHRYDPRHLNRPGAEELSRLLAQAFAEHLRSRAD